MGFPVKFPGMGGFCRGQHHGKQLPQPRIQVGLRGLSFFYRFHKTNGGIQAGVGHFQGGACPDTCGVVIAAAPVGHDEAAESPVLAQDILEQVGVFVGVGAVYRVIAGHDGFWMPLFYGDLKGGKVDLPQGALVHHGVRRQPPGLLGVDGKVLRAGGGAVFLNAPDIGGGHFACQVGILGEVFKIPPAEGAALHVQTRAQHHMDAAGGGFLAKGTAQRLTQFRRPGIGHGGGGGEAGGGVRGVQAQMVSGAGLAAQAVGAVGQEHSRDPKPGNGVGLPVGSALKQEGFFFQGQACNVCIYGHGVLLSGFSGKRATGWIPLSAFAGGWFRLIWPAGWLWIKNVHRGLVVPVDVRRIIPFRILPIFRRGLPAGRSLPPRFRR